MRRILIGAVAVVLFVGVWIGWTSWGWSRVDTAALFRDRIKAEAPSGSAITVIPGSVVSGDLDDASKLVCGTVSRQEAAAGRSDVTYSLVLIKTMFGHRINDGYTPATRPENQAVSDQNCAALRAHVASHAG